ncbi:hypothetical protein [Vagococcus acidifermentans]|uniref:Uncharacterized protein n=1 Tax=Vagococcus acidifermentans TaxID=564710 RepID=A0A430AUV4_9ENTE|nr:hypothetical protein [Vagococcus acidifermentans]RSU11837.1 hypothetical protein CBF27_07720 [Vagococcus acidifermentans]
MNKQKTMTFSVLLWAAIILLQTAASILPAWQINISSSNVFEPWWQLIFYLLLCEIFQSFAKLMNRKGKFVPLIFYIIKIAASFLLIYSITSKTTFYFALIFIAYEFFQLLSIAKQFKFVESISYTLLNSFFKGMVFNLVIVVDRPFVFNLDLFKPFVISTALFLMLTSLIQGLYAYQRKKFPYLIMSFAALIMTYILIFNRVSVLTLVLFTISNFLMLYLFTKVSGFLSKEFFASAFVLISLLLYY